MWRPPSPRELARLACWQELRIASGMVVWWELLLSRDGRLSPERGASPDLEEDGRRAWQQQQQQAAAEHEQPATRKTDDTPNKAQPCAHPPYPIEREPPQMHPHLTSAGATADAPFHLLSSPSAAVGSRAHREGSNDATLAATTSVGATSAAPSLASHQAVPPAAADQLRETSTAAVSSSPAAGGGGEDGHHAGADNGSSHGGAR